MHQEDLIYDNAKEILKTYGKVTQKSINEKVIYECAAVIYSIKQDYKEDTRSYNITESIYEIEKEMIFRLQKMIRPNEDGAQKAAELCKHALAFIELVVKPRINVKSLVC